MSVQILMKKTKYFLLYQRTLNHIASPFLSYNQLRKSALPDRNLPQVCYQAHALHPVIVKNVSM